MRKIDLKRERQHLYRPPSDHVVLVEVPAMQFLMVDGRGDPNRAPSFQEAVEALYAVSYHLKFMVKRSESALDYGVMPLEGLWWTEDMSAFSVDDKSRWEWTIMIMQPDFVSREQVDSAVSEVGRKKDLPALQKIRFEVFEEGKAAQIMHIGPFAGEGPTVEKVHDFIEERGFVRRGKHHEVYLSDIRRADPAKWRTIIRQPIG
jgi:hypothetical protein